MCCWCTGVYICFLVLRAALTAKRSSLAGTAPVLLGKGKTFCSYSSWTLCMGSSMWPPQLLLVLLVGKWRKLPHRSGHWVTEPWVLFVAFMSMIEVHLHPLEDAGRVFVTREVHFWESMCLALIGPPNIHITGTSTGRPGSITFMFLDTVWPLQFPRATKPHWAGHKSSVARYTCSGHKSHQ